MTAPAFLFVDLETTGLDPASSLILECYAIPVDETLEPTGEPFHAIRSLSHVPALPAAVFKMHSRNRLLAACLEPELANEAYRFGGHSALAEELGDYFESIGADRSTWLAGNSVHFDARFLRSAGVDVGRLSHRILDTTSILRAVALAGIDIDLPPRDEMHRARGDIEWSLEATRRALHFLNQAAFEVREIEAWQRGDHE